MKDSFRSLFKKKEQAPSFPVSAKVECQMDILVKQWVDGKGYRLPDHGIIDSALHIGTDTTSLIRYFKLRGDDFRSFRMRLRLEDAKIMLLEEPGSSAASIARRVGYGDRSNFTTHFREYTGLTPDVWRRKNALSQRIEQ